MPACCCAQRGQHTHQDQPPDEARVSPHQIANLVLLALQRLDV
jgi:hypothetical protein